LEVAVVPAAARSAAAAAAVGFVLLAGFQLTLALGAPLGRAAWGGAHDRLPAGLRIASAFAAVFWVVAALAVLARAGYAWSPIPRVFAIWATWILFGLLVLGALMNLASQSRWERFLMSPIAALLSLLCLLVALAADKIVVLATAGLFLSALVVGRRWLLLVPAIGVPLVFLGLILGWWGYGVGDGWQVLIIVWVLVGMLAVAAGLLLRRVIVSANRSRRSPTP
jgi:hypothetical protein